ncbi:OmpA family protein [Hymenobacter sp. BRD128]|uniref:OmpA family protein n=1 Tax=Hymenobacter sp. BRD128 TaxID=2675878 RepID=UPI0015653348|nr:OmpA family protein [Hymenobacter sp. BRD128]QKG56020.1 OmpA family protein [Hymenobacter sp. BRD128]
MKLLFRLYGLPALLLAGPAGAQSLAGVWQGVEDEQDKSHYCPSVLRVQQRAGADLFGVLYQEDGNYPRATVTFQMEGTPTPAGLRLVHARKLSETGRTPLRYWCEGAILFTYDAALEKLTGRADYTPYGECDTGEFTLYRVKLKSAATVPAGALTTLRVSGRNVRWYADADLKQLVASGNSYPTRLTKTTTFYLKQGYFATVESPTVPITIRVSGKAPAGPPLARQPAPTPAPSRPDTLRPVPASPLATVPTPAAAPLPELGPAPVVLPTVLFRVGTAELLPEARPALDQLAAALHARPALRLRVAGHTDRVGESSKNQLLSEQRAEVVKAYLVQAGVAAERLSPVGYGDKRPLYPSPDARNRRVEVQELPPAGG